MTALDHGLSATLAMAPRRPRVERLDRAVSGTVRLSLLRGFELQCDGSVVPLAMGSRRLVAFLALRERPLPRTYVAEMLWTDAPDRRAWANLRSSLWRLRGLRHRVVEQAGDDLQLSRDVAVDVRDAYRAASELVAGTRSAGLDVDLRVFEGDLLPGWCDEWVLVERERHRQLGLHALELLCERLSLEGRHCQAVQAGLAAVSGDPLRESAHRALIGAHIAEGNVNEAIRQFELFEGLIKHELGLEPSDGLKRLITSL
jgi:DNA-binding SARP family transcriptional activator